MLCLEVATSEQKPINRTAISMFKNISLKTFLSRIQLTLRATRVDNPRRLARNYKYACLVGENRRSDPGIVRMRGSIVIRQRPRMTFVHTLPPLYTNDVCASHASPGLVVCGYSYPSSEYHVQVHFGQTVWMRTYTTWMVYFRHDGWNVLH